MAGRFEGLSNLEWKLFEDIFPTSDKRSRGMPHVPFRYVLNSLLYILITGCRWCDLPEGEIWASKSSAHRWLKRWQKDGTFEHLQGRILAIADNQGLINWNYGAIDGSFSPGKGGGDEVAYGYKGKGILIHTLTEGNGMPLSNCTTAANGSEREQILPLLDSVKLKTLKKGRPKKRVKVLAADKGYDSQEKRAV